MADPFVLASLGLAVLNHLEIDSAANYPLPIFTTIQFVMTYRYGIHTYVALAWERDPNLHGRGCVHVTQQAEGKKNGYGAVHVE